MDHDLLKTSGFHWGAAISAYQCEGAADTDGKGASIWDEFTKIPGAIVDQSNGADACQFYHRYRDDLMMMKALGIPNFRFSISWSRVMPDGSGRVNEAGIAYYNALIDTCVEFGITPWITLYHWDLPAALEAKGGWTNRTILQWFEAYARLCGERFGDRVKHWIVLNEPLVFTGAGYFYGVHAPGRKSLSDFLAAVHHAALAQAVGAKALRRSVEGAQIGTSISSSFVSPRRNHLLDRRAATRVDIILNRLFVEAFLGMGYPMNELKGLRLIEKFMEPGDEESMQFDFDFLGLQTYTREVVKYSMFTPILRAKLIPHQRRKRPLTEMNWEVFPEGMYELLMKFSAYKGIKQIIVTENGAAFKDDVGESLVNDPERIRYLNAHIRQVQRAKKDGAKVGGYFVWSLLDNFEWAEGYRPKFGLIHVDFKTQQRKLKQSALWYARYLNS